MKTTRFERFIVKLNGRIYRYHEQQTGWNKPLPIYLAKCMEHGYYEDNQHGYENRLDCPKCHREYPTQMEAPQIEA